MTQEPGQLEMHLSGPSIGINPRIQNIREQRNLGEYIEFPGAVHGVYTRPNLLVPFRPNFSAYWEDAHLELIRLNARMLTPRDFVDFLIMLKRGTANNGNGKPIGVNALTGLLNSLINSDEFDRELFDARFRTAGAEIIMEYSHTMLSGRIKPRHTITLTKYARGRGKIGLLGVNDLGLPGTHAGDTGIGNQYYFSPLKGKDTVTTFSCRNRVAELDCRASREESFLVRACLLS